MKSTQLKVLSLAVSFFAFSAAFAQDDTSKTPKPDTSKMPKQDTTSMVTKGVNHVTAANHVNLLNTTLTGSENIVAAKHEAIEDENLNRKVFAQISA